MFWSYTFKTRRAIHGDQPQQHYKLNEFSQRYPEMHSDCRFILFYFIFENKNSSTADYLKIPDHSQHHIPSWNHVQTPHMNLRNKMSRLCYLSTQLQLSPHNITLISLTTTCSKTFMHSVEWNCYRRRLCSEISEQKWESIRVMHE